MGQWAIKIASEARQFLLAICIDLSPRDTKILAQVILLPLDSESRRKRQRQARSPEPPQGRVTQMSTGWRQTVFTAEQVGYV